MALTVTKTASGRFDGQSDLGYWAGTITFDTAYASGGEVLTKEDMGFKTLYTVQLTPDHAAATPSGTLLPVWDASAEKVLLFEPEDTGNLMQQIGADDVSALVVNVYAVGLN